MIFCGRSDTVAVEADTSIISNIDMRTHAYVHSPDLPLSCEVFQNETLATYNNLCYKYNNKDLVVNKIRISA